MAGLKVEQYFDQLIDGKARLRPLPSALATLLRERLPYAVHDAGVNRAVELAHRAEGQGRLRRRRQGPMQRGARRAAGAGPAAGAGLRRPAAPRAAEPAPAPGTPAAPPQPGKRRDDALASAASLLAALALLGPVAGELAAQDSAGVVAPPRPPPAADSAAPAPAGPPLRPPWRHGRRHRSWWTGCVAVVGNRPVLASQVDEEVFSRQSQGQQLPTDPDRLAAIRKQVIASIVDEELLVQQAQRDTAIKVTDQEIADGVEQQVRKVRGNFTSEVDYKNELKKAGFRTPEEYRRWLTRPAAPGGVPEPADREAAQDGKLKPVSPTEQEMRAYFEEQKGQPRQPAGDALVPADRHRAAARRPRPRRAPGPGRLDRARAAAGRRFRHRGQAASRRIRARRTRAARSTGSGGG